MPLETSAESPVPVRMVLQMVGNWINRLGRIWVEGQIAELSGRGNTVFITLRDPVSVSSVRVTCSRRVYQQASAPPQEGARVVVWAKPDFYLTKGSFALTALEIRPIGLGELLARLERLRRALAAEGLFSADRKRALPFLPSVVGVICGRDSAAEHDVVENGRRRWPAVRFRVEPVAVQGTAAVTDVTDALRRLDNDRDVDVIIVARGGGSIEDLLPFSDEGLVRAVAACRTPVVSAIGHEQDTPLLDLVADMRASTPTDAAKRVVPDVAEQLELVRRLRDRGRRWTAGRLERELAWLRDMRSRPALADPVREVERQAEHVLGLRDRARRSMEATLSRAADGLAHTKSALIALSPAGTLRRGYAIATRSDGRVLRAAADATIGERIVLRFATDRLDADVRDIHPDQ